MEMPEFPDLDNEDQDFYKDEGTPHKLVATCLKLKITGCLFKCSTYSQVVQLVYNKWLFIKDVKVKDNKQDLQQVLCHVKSVHEHLWFCYGNEFGCVNIIFKTDEFQNII